MTTNLQTAVCKGDTGYILVPNHVDAAVQQSFLSWRTVLYRVGRLWVVDGAASEEDQN